MERTVRRIVDFASQISEAEQIILFGSMANDTHNIHSDIDLLIISNEFFSKKEIAEKIKQYARNFSLSIDVLLYDRPEIEKAVKKPHSFIESVLKSGKIVYERKKTLNF